MLIFPTKTRVYFVPTQAEKEMWVKAFKTTVGHCVLTDYYELGAVIGQGKYGIVR